MWTPNPKNRQQLCDTTQQPNPTIRPLIHHQNRQKTHTTTNKHPHLECRKRKQMDVRRHQQLPLRHTPNRHKPHQTQHPQQLNPTQQQQPTTTKQPKNRVCVCVKGRQKMFRSTG